jgi:CheY-like chemotaxis protein
MLSRHKTARLLRAKAAEFRCMSKTTADLVDVQALDDLATRCAELAERSEADEPLAGSERDSPDNPLSPEAPRAAETLDRTRNVGRHVLVVDDVRDVLITAEAFLRSAGYVVTTAADGDTALRIIANDPRIGVLVTDFAMPGLSGVELITLAAQIRPDLRALVITGYPNADGLEGLSPQIALLIKPFRRATLIAGVNFLFGQTQSGLPDESMEVVYDKSG